MTSLNTTTQPARTVDRRSSVTSDLSLEQKASLASGADLFRSKAVGPVPAVHFADGPHGVRRQTGDTGQLGMSGSEPATCFPPAAGLGQSWDISLVRRVGVALGVECQAAGIGVLLGPGLNIRRSPLGGRNFEYVSEDPVLTAAFGTAWVEGIQSQGVGASLKHFAANDQESDRMRVSAEVAPRPLRELHLRAFERVVTEAKPWTVMAAYNRVNGVPATENHLLLTEVLREDWGFDGAVISDWGAVNDRVAAARAGLDLQMPGNNGRDDAVLVAAVERGELDKSVIDGIARRIADLADKVATAAAPDETVDVERHHELAREAAARSIVLLRNEDALLPLEPGSTLAVIGDLAANPRYQGGGSSHVNANRVDIPLDELRALGDAFPITYARGYRPDGADEATLRAEAVAAARDADVAVLFLGLDESDESEGYDRTTIDLPEAQLSLARAVHEANPRTVVVLAHGGVVRLAPLREIPAILDGALLGQGGGHAIAAVLYGLVNPSGRLTETVPERIQDTPAFGNFPGEHGRVVYGEGLLVGYRWYDTRDIDVTFPFGHGLSYTDFEYSDLNLTAESDGIHARLSVRNIGSRAGREVVQIYASVPESSVDRPVRELKAFDIVDLEPGDQATVSVLLRRHDLAYWDERPGRWIVESGDYLIAVGASSRDIRVEGSIEVTGDPLYLPLSMNSTVMEVVDHPIAGPVMIEALKVMSGGPDVDEAVVREGLRMGDSAPVRLALEFMGGAATTEGLQALFDQANSASQ